MDDLKALASRLALVYQGSRQLEELRFPGLATRAQTLSAQDPITYAQIACQLMDGQSAHKIAKTNKVSPDLVRFIRSMHPELVHAARNQLISNLEETSIAMAQRLAQEVEDLPLAKLPHSLSTVLDKLALLTGGVTQRTEHVQAPKPEDVQRMFEQLPKATS